MYRQEIESHNALIKAQVPSSNSVWWSTLDFDITIVNTAVERSFPLYAPAFYDTKLVISPLPKFVKVMTLYNQKLMVL